MYQCSEMLVRISGVQKALTELAYAFHWTGGESVANTSHIGSEDIFHGYMDVIEMFNEKERQISGHKLHSIEMEATTTSSF